MWYAEYYKQQAAVCTPINAQLLLCLDDERLFYERDETKGSQTDGR